MKKLHLRSQLLISLSLLCACQFTSSVRADDASLDSIWMDQPAPPTKEENTVPLVSLSSPAPLSSTAAPMIGLEDFRNSQFVSKGAWPGIGPFSNRPSGELIDAANNVIKLETSHSQILRAELGLAADTNATRDFLDIEMSADFLLEALGAKPAKIAEFNSELEKNRERITNSRTPQTFSAGRYQITIDRSRRDPNYAVVISVNSLDANKAAIRAHSVSPPEKPPVMPEVQPSLTPAPPAPVKKPVPPASAAINPSIDPRRDEFANVVKTWQNIKKAAVRKRDTAELSEVLAGRALARQTDAVKWLVTHQKYYDMTPRGVVVDKYQEQIPGKKVLVLAQVREFSKYIDEPSGQVLKEVDDKYTVNYTLEKIGDRWKITDSELLSSQPPKTPAKPPAR